MHRKQGGYLVPLLHLIMMGAMAGVVYGCWLMSGWISGLIIAAEDQGKDSLGRVFITMAILSAFTVGLTIFNYFVPPGRGVHPLMGVATLVLMGAILYGGVMFFMSIGVHQ